MKTLLQRQTPQNFHLNRFFFFFGGGGGDGFKSFPGRIGIKVFWFFFFGGGGGGNDLKVSQEASVSKFLSFGVEWEIQTLATSVLG